jgi:hypothetical protein
MPIPTPKAGQDKNEFMSECISFLKNEGKPQDQSVAICIKQWESKNEMDNLLNRINKLLIKDQSGATVDSNVATNTAKGKIDVVSRDCPEGKTWCPIRKKCIPIEDMRSKGRGRGMAVGKGAGPINRNIGNY